MVDVNANARVMTVAMQSELATRTAYAKFGVVAFLFPSALAGWSLVSANRL